MRKDITRALKRPSANARCLARLAGQCISMCRAVFPGKLKLRVVYRLLKTKSSWQASLSWCSDAVDDLTWWNQALDSWNGTTVLPGPVTSQLYMDANTRFLHYKVQGFWNKRVAYESCNYREMLAVLMTVPSLSSKLHGQTIQLLSDNISTVCYMGGPRQRLISLAKAIWSKCLHGNILQMPRHYPGVLNNNADSSSTMSNKYEWCLHPHLFGLLDILWGPHTCDSFATMTNTHLPVYNSQYTDPLSCPSPHCAKSTVE